MVEQPKSFLHIGRLKRHRASILVWLGAIGIALWLYALQHRSIAFMGIAQADSVQIMASRTARVETLGVSLLETVTEGQVLAVLKDEQPREHLTVANAEIERLKSELAALQESLTQEDASFQQDVFATKRRFLLDADTARLKRLELQTVLEPNRIRLKEMEVELKAAKALADKGLYASLQLAREQTAFDALAREVREQEALLEQISQDLALAESRRDSYLGEDEQNLARESSFDQRLMVVSKAIRVQELKVEALQQELATLILTAPMAGQVTELWTQTRQVVLPGQALMSISQPKANRVLAYVAERDSQRMKLGMQVEIVTLGPNPVKAKAQIETLSVGLVKVPERLTPRQDRPIWGRTVFLSLPADFPALPGEKVGIRQ